MLAGVGACAVDKLDGAHLLEPLHPGLSLRSPIPAGAASGGGVVVVRQPGTGGADKSPTINPSSLRSGGFSVNTESSFTGDNGQKTGNLATSQPPPDQANRRQNLNQFHLKCGLGWSQVQTALFNCAACCVKCIGPV